MKWPDVNPCNPAVVARRWTASKSQSSSCIKWAKSKTTKVAVKSRPNIAVKDKYLGSVSQSANVCISILVRKSPEALWEFFFLICHHLPGCWHWHHSHQAGGSSSPGNPTSCSLRQITTSLMHRQAEQSAAGEEQKGTRLEASLSACPRTVSAKLLLCLLTAANVLHCSQTCTSSILLAPNSGASPHPAGTLSQETRSTSVKPEVLAHMNTSTGRLEMLF